MLRRPPVTPNEIRKLIELYAATPPRQINLATLLSFGRPLTAESLLASASYALAEIPRRLATRCRSLEALPFIVGTNPYIAKTLSAYHQSLSSLASYPPPKTFDDNVSFATTLERLVQRHANDIPTMAKGFQECSRYMSPEQVSTFLDGAIRNRISVRLIAEQHVALSRAFGQPQGEDIGIVNMHCSPAKMISMCGSFVSELCEATLGASPRIVIDGDGQATFAYVPVHLEYIMTELLKNAFRATVEHQQKQAIHLLPPIQITISCPPRSDAMEAETFLSMRIRDQGGGVSKTNMSRIFSYAFTTAGKDSELDDGGGPYAAQYVGGGATFGGPDSALFGDITAKGVQTGIGTIAGLGYGLPMSRLYAKYFGGSLDLVPLEGWGSDVFLKLRCLDEAGDSTI